MTNLVTDWLKNNFINLLAIIKHAFDEVTTTKKFHLKLNDGWAVFKDDEKELTQDVVVKVVNNQCYIEGLIYNMNMNTRYMFKLPDEAKPSDTKELICLTEKGVDSVIIRKTGEVIFINRQKARLVNLNSIQYHR